MASGLRMTTADYYDDCHHHQQHHDYDHLNGSFPRAKLGTSQLHSMKPTMESNFKLQNPKNCPESRADPVWVLRLSTKKLL